MQPEASLAYSKAAFLLQEWARIVKKEFKLKGNELLIK